MPLYSQISEPFLDDGRICPPAENLLQPDKGRVRIAAENKGGYAITYLPGWGTELTLNGTPLITIEGADSRFWQAIESCRAHRRAVKQKRGRNDGLTPFVPCSSYFLLVHVGVYLSSSSSCSRLKEVS